MSVQRQACERKPRQTFQETKSIDFLREVWCDILSSKMLILSTAFGIIFCAMAFNYIFSDIMITRPLFLCPCTSCFWMVIGCLVCIGCCGFSLSVHHLGHFSQLGSLCVRCLKNSRTRTHSTMLHGQPPNRLAAFIAFAFSVVVASSDVFYMELPGWSIVTCATLLMRRSDTL